MKITKILKFGWYLARLYFSAFPRILYRSTLSMFVDPIGSMKFLHDVVDGIDLGFDDPVLGSTTIVDLLPGDFLDIEIVGPYYSPKARETRILLELASLMYLVKTVQPKLIFEIGTFVGLTTRLFARNSSDECKIFTLDLEQEKVSHAIGTEYADTSEQKKINQLYGNSRTFDFSPWFGMCDIIWVDGCHDYPFVVSDSWNALKLCKPGGWIVWHDYRHSRPWMPVPRCIRELAAQHNLPVKHIRGTTISMLKKNET